MFLKVVGCALAAAFVGYCIYFDKKRRVDPNYKRHVRERRLRAKMVSEYPSLFGIPNLNNQDALERFFVQEFQLGQALINRGEIENGVEHMAKAIFVCAQAERTLQMLQRGLPPDIFSLLLTKIQFLRDRIRISTDGVPRIRIVESEDDSPVPLKIEQEKYSR